MRKTNKINAFLLVTSVLSTAILLISATFSYFTTQSMSKMNAVAIEAGKIKLGLGVSSLYTGHKLIPMNDNDVMKAYNQECIDDLGNGACLAYSFEVFNYEKSVDVSGTIDFNVDGIEHLSYMILDENNNVYLDKTSVSNGVNEKLSLGDGFTLEDGTSLNGNSKKFYLLIWLTNLDEAQEAYDAGGSFSASITYNSIYGGRLSTNISGYESDNNNVAELGGA